MANNCFFDMKITGKKENVEELIQMLKWKGEFVNSGLGRVYSCDEVERYDYGNNIISTLVCGDCAWSVLTAMCAWGRFDTPSLESETKRLNLIVEVYSTETGCAFQEHFLIKKGIVEINDCVDYEEHWIADYENIEEYNEEWETNFTADMVDENGNICIGGFENYGDFEDFSNEFLN